jgi:hypothetical protein
LDYFAQTPAISNETLLLHQGADLAHSAFTAAAWLQRANLDGSLSSFFNPSLTL